MRPFFLAAMAALLVAAPAIAAPDPGVTCSQAMSDDPEFAGIAKKLALKDVRDITMPMLANRTYPTAKERAALADWFKRHDDCVKAADPVRRAMYSPKLYSLLGEADDGLKSVGSELYAKRIAFGEANRQLLQYKDAILARVAEVVTAERASADAAASRARQQAVEAQARQEAAAQAQAQLDMQAEAARQAEQDRRRAIIMQMIQANRPYQVPMPAAPAARPAPTNCTTSYVGSQAYTTCN